MFKIILNLVSLREGVIESILFVIFLVGLSVVFDPANLGVSLRKVCQVRIRVDCFQPLLAPIRWGFAR
jgi:hypothetical protein